MSARSKKPAKNKPKKNISAACSKTKGLNKIQFDETLAQLVFDKNPLPTVLLKNDASIIASNKAMHKWISEKDKTFIGLQPGDALQCMQALNSPEGCGMGSACGQCELRRIVNKTLETGSECYRQYTCLELIRGEADVMVHLLVTTVNLSFNSEKYVLVTIEDVTDHQIAESQLRKSESEFKRFTQTVADVIYRYDPNKNQYDFISPSFQEQTGYTLEELKNDPRNFVNKITHPEDSQKIFDEIERHILKGPNAGPITMDYRIIHKNGDIIWIRDTKTIEFDDNGSVSIINGVVADISQRKFAEEALLDSEERV